MLIGTVIIWSMLAVVAILGHRQKPPVHREAAEHAWDQFKTIAMRMPFALLAAGFIINILPQEAIVARLGEGSGITGILTASFLGAFLPGGPMVSFPIAVVIREAGAGGPQMIALLTSWSVLAVHRVLSFELPLLGGQFVLVRLASSLILPVIAGVISALFWW